jgi:16S rRNA (guanine1207-N2)-methyltransferase
MNDDAFQLLLPALKNSNKNCLWVVDENISDSVLVALSPRANLQLLTNRYDIWQQFSAAGFSILLNDFEREAFLHGSFEQVVYRVSKEKAIVHHIINSASYWLQVEGQLLLAGYKNDGIKTYAKKAANYLGDLTGQQRGNKTAQQFSIAYDGCVGPSLDDQGYCEFHALQAAELEFVSKPGQFGWNKVDKGSQFLVECLAGYLPGHQPAVKTVLDLGCGYGYLSLAVSRLCDASFTATDNNVAAVASCQQNFRMHGVEGNAILADCADGLSDTFDLIVCNPPFHQGFEVEGQLTDKFLRNASRLLAVKGVAIFVVNAFIPLEKKAQAFFQRIETLGNNRSFKVLLLAH